MKKLLLLLFLCPIGQSYASEIRHHNLSINTFSILWGGFDLRYEYQYNAWLTFTVPLDAEFSAASPTSTQIQNYARAIASGLFPRVQLASGFGTRFDYEGFYVEPMVKLGYTQIALVATRPPNNYFLVRPMVYFGYQRTFDFGLSLNFGIGPTFNAFIPQDLANNFPFFDVMMGVGYAF